MSIACLTPQSLAVPRISIEAAREISKSSKLVISPLDILEIGVKGLLTYYRLHHLDNLPLLFLGISRDDLPQLFLDTSCGDLRHLIGNSLNLNDPELSHDISRGDHPTATRP